MSAPDLIGLFVEPLETVGIAYMITGGVASVIYGDPRFTRDIDLVVELHPVDAPRLASAFDTRGFYLPPIEVLERESSRPPGGHFNIIHRDSALRADVYVAGDDPLHAWAFERRQRLEIGAVEISVAPLEYVVLRKLEYYRDSGSDRHLRDVAMMLRISGDMLDEGAFAGWVERLGLERWSAAARGYRSSDL